jgi:DNA-binding MarR family transcriptional regulator
MDKVRVSRAVARALARGLVHRAVDGMDRRRSVLTLTGEGRALHDRVVPLVLAREAQLLAVLAPEEAAALKDALRRLEGRAVELGGSVSA